MKANKKKKYKEERKLFYTSTGFGVKKISRLGITKNLKSLLYLAKEGDNENK